jgi:hypothetical protein
MDNSLWREPAGRVVPLSAQGPWKVAENNWFIRFESTWNSKKEEKALDRRLYTDKASREIADVGEGGDRATRTWR